MVGLVSATKGGRTASNHTVDDTADLLVASRGNRKSVTFQNQGSATVFLGGSAVAVSGENRGYALFAGATFTDNASSGAWYGVVATGSAIVHVIEVA